jgi:hypothetical protein
MPPTADATTLNLQPQQRRDVYEGLALMPETKFKDLVGELDIPEPELRIALRKLDAAGLARRTKGTWSAIPLETDEPAPDAAAPDAE